MGRCEGKIRRNSAQHHGAIRAAGELRAIVRTAIQAPDGGFRHTDTLALGAPENQEARGVVAVLEDQLPAHFAAGVFGHHHDVRGIASRRKPCFFGPFGESIEAFVSREGSRISSALIWTTTSDMVPAPPLRPAGY